MKTSILTKSQFKTFTKQIDYYGTPADIIATIRFDDRCGNGHNTLSVTGQIYKAGRRSDRAFLSGGCVHEEISKHFPELRRAIDFHLVSTDGPMHYVANSLYHASDRDCWGKRKGEPKSFEEVIYFNNVPMQHKEPKRGFFDFIREHGNGPLTLLAVEHENKKGDSYKYTPNYTIKEFEDYRKAKKEEHQTKWHYCPFSNKQEAQEWIDCFNTCDFRFEKICTAWGEGKEPDLEAARRCALWPDAKLEDFTKENLEARLPQLLDELVEIVESFGFTY